MVTAILVLCGLPYASFSSVLAHEATHAWMKLDPSFPSHLPPQVRCCVVALLCCVVLWYGVVCHCSVSLSGREIRCSFITMVMSYSSHLERFDVGTAAVCLTRPPARILMFYVPTKSIRTFKYVIFFSFFFLSLGHVRGGPAVAQCLSLQCLSFVISV